MHYLSRPWIWIALLGLPGSHLPTVAPQLEMAVQEATQATSVQAQRAAGLRSKTARSSQLLFLFEDGQPPPDKKPAQGRL
ncbi:hypothetical protein GCM10007907_26300 [Chitinimonas prasina]|uniref:Uncharacterized protein n=1 Tax=Chitinimonas prasina TaxID=1434937 RepID=A0ABQ5YKH2_9NEIS|nr:hypothetical protein [Chitinimonas prasina]GLR13840.1 hypothetical protein GCM10007907_26300 [Chitinimonas prasina]